MGANLSLLLAIVTAEVVVVSFSIQTVFVILMILYFHRVSSLALITNLIVVPLVGLIVPLGFLCLLTSFISQPVSLVLAKLCILLLRPLLALALYFSGEEWGNYRLASPPVWTVVVYFFLLGCILAPCVLKRIRLLAVFLAIVLLCAILLYPFAPRLPANKLQITLIDVRQGDSILLSFPGNGTMLIDGGGLLGRSFGEVYSEEEFDVGERVISPFLWSLGLRRIDRLVLTHAHHDHMAGLRAVLTNFPVQEFWIGNNPLNPDYVDLLKMALRKNVFIRNFWRGDKAQVGDGRFQFLNPETGAAIGPTPKNNDSLAFRLQYRERSFLLTGDIERKIEGQLIANSLEIKSDVLKVGHHGSRTSTSSEFLSQVQPVWALISVAAHSPFGHPHPETIQCLLEHRVPIFRTDRDGAVTLKTDGRNLEVSLYADQ
jgi:competence protein ComEC